MCNVNQWITVCNEFPVMAGVSLFRERGGLKKIVSSLSPSWLLIMSHMRDKRWKQDKESHWGRMNHCLKYRQAKAGGGEIRVTHSEWPLLLWLTNYLLWTERLSTLTSSDSWKVTFQELKENEDDIFYIDTIFMFFVCNKPQMCFYRTGIGSSTSLTLKQSVTYQKFENIKIGKYFNYSLHIHIILFKYWWGTSLFTLHIICN